MQSSQNTPNDTTRPQRRTQAVDSIITIGDEAFARRDRQPEMRTPYDGCHTYEVWTLRDGATVLAYVGIADKFESRWKSHQAQSWWLGETDVRRIDVTAWKSREAARRYEATRINDADAPLYNVRDERAAHVRAQSDDGWWDEMLSSYELTPLGAVQAVSSWA